jgi:hypothetical protein
MARISTFNWSQLDRQTLFNIMYELRERIVGHTLPSQKFHDLIIKHVKGYIPIKGRKQLSSEVQKSWVYVGGAYYGDLDKERNTSIELCLTFNPKDKAVEMSGRRFTRFCIGFADTILHEIIHMRQFRKRKFKALPDYPSTATRINQRKEQEYLGNFDEIDAYSFNIACELDDKFNGNIKKIVAYLNEDQKGTRRTHNSFRMYLKAFGHDHNHLVIKRVKKRAIHYLSKAVNGKPFRSVDWINR